MNQAAGDVAVVNADDPETVKLAAKAKVPVYAFTVAHPADPGCKGLPVSAPLGVNVAGRAVGSGSGFAFDFGARPRFALRNKALRGEHNVQNAMAAALLAFHSGIDATAIQKGLDSYPGLPHRLEFGRVLDEVEWINDSKATNVESSLVALRAFPGNLWLIAGGRGKGAPYAPMVEASKGKVKGVLTIGEDAKKIEDAYRAGFEVRPCETLEKAIARARELAEPGDIVLLSPACASYDQFKNFEDRGETFKRLVKGLR
jgi:UDP-N-acetylmuramoylalanine--D-glutamate ligase